MTAPAAPRLAAVVLAARGGARLAEALAALAWADRRVVLGFDGALLAHAGLPGDVLRVTSPARLAEVDADWLLLLGEEERVRAEDVARLRAAAAAAAPGDVLALRVESGALDLRVRLGRAVGRLGPRTAHLRVQPGFDVELAGARPPHVLDVALVRSRGATLTDAVALVGADAALFAAIAERRRARGRGILWHPLVAGARTLAARGVGRPLGLGRWVLAVLEGYRVVVAYAKLWERRRNRVAVLP